VVLNPQAKECKMTASDDLSRLSDRAAQAEKNVEAAKGKGQAALKAQADAARKSAAAQASSLEKDAAAAGAGAKAKAAGLETKSSDSWRDMKTQWRDHVSKLHHKHDHKADLGAKHVEHHAEVAERDAEHAVKFAYCAIEEAESACLDAIQARAAADDPKTPQSPATT
jgi:hypothetical protein